jgi:hypothetical protein
MPIKILFWLNVGGLADDVVLLMVTVKVEQPAEEQTLAVDVPGLTP